MLALGVANEGIQNSEEEEGKRTAYCTAQVLVVCGVCVCYVPAEIERGWKWKGRPTWCPPRGAIIEMAKAYGGQQPAF